MAVTVILSSGVMDRCEVLHGASFTWMKIFLAVALILLSGVKCYMDKDIVFLAVSVILWSGVVDRCEV